MPALLYTRLYLHLTIPIDMIMLSTLVLQCPSAQCTQ